MEVSVVIPLLNEEENIQLKIMPRWLSRHSTRIVIERSLVRIQPGAYLEGSIKQQTC